MLILYIFILSVFSNLINESRIDTDYIDQNKINRIIHSLSLREKVGQLLIYGFKGKYAQTHANKLIEKYSLGGVILFSHNVKSKEQIVKLTRTMQNTSIFSSGVPLFISVDQEGGKVLRLKNIATTLPGNMNLGASGSSILSYLAGKLTAIDLETLGINMNFAPVIDVNTSADNKVIGVRSFGDNPDEVSRLGVAYIKGLQSRRVSATAKHFPGHGAVSIDSHYATPVINYTYKELDSVDLKPFKAAINDGVDGIMTAHVSLPKIDASAEPATISKTIITGILREKLGFNGLVITDDMEMNGILSKTDIGSAAVKSILAGCDIITVVWSAKAKDTVYNALYKAVKSGVISEKRLNVSLNRIIRTKLKRKLYRYPDPNIKKIKKIVGNRFHRHIAKLIAKKSITMVKNNSALPLDRNKKYLVISNSNYFIRKINKLGFNTETIKGKIVIVASLDSPYLVNKIKNLDAYVCSYSFRNQAVRELANVLTGKNKALGNLPVKVN